MRLEPFATLNEMRKQYGLRKTAMLKLDDAVTRFTAGLGINDIRSVLRGDPAGKPNPRVKPHTEGAIFHIWPSFYHAAVTKLYPTFRLGLISTALFLIEIITGLFLMIYYTPAPGTSYENMLRILSNVPLGQFVRDIHRLAAEGMVVAVWLHMGRTYLTGSYKKPRQFTWATGVILLLVTIALSYTGYLLPWDQLSYWAVTIGASMADAAPPPEVGKAVALLLKGAPDLGAGGLLRFYLLHVFALPLVAILFLFVHYYKVIRHGHSLPPGMEAVGEDNARKVPQDKRVPFLPDIFTNEILWFGLILAAMILPIALNLYHAPLEHAANAQSTPLEAVSWITPQPALLDLSFSGRPSIPAIQSSTCVSSSVQAGLVAHNMPCTPRPAESNSPRMDGPELLAGKKAKKLGDCQCVMPGRMSFSTSARMASKGSPLSGGSGGSDARI